MIGAALALGALALALAWPVPILLERARWTRRAPATALLLWQAIALAGGLSMIGALLTFGLAPFGAHLVDAALGLVAAIAENRPLSAADLPHLFALCGAALLGGHLLLNLGLTIVRTERQRRRHAHLVQLLSTPMPDRPRTRVLDNAVPVAYCLPSGVHSVTVFSAGLLRLLGERELRAVVEHERAHVAQRHDVVLVAFRAWHASLPWFPIANRAQREVGALVEMLADDRARRHVDDETLATAIALVAGAPDAATAEPGDVTAAPRARWAEVASPDQVRDRVRRLLIRTPALGAPTRAAVLVGALALLVVPTVLLFGPAVERF